MKWIFLTSLYHVKVFRQKPPQMTSSHPHFHHTSPTKRLCGHLGKWRIFSSPGDSPDGVWVRCFLRETAIGYSIVVDVIYPDREDNAEDFFESFWNHSCPSCSRTNGISHFHISLAVQVYLLPIWVPGYPRNGWDGFLDTFAMKHHETSIVHSLGWIFDRDP